MKRNKLISLLLLTLLTFLVTAFCIACDINCNDNDETDIPHEHTKITLKGVSATCTTTGLTDGVKCSSCEEILIPQVVLPKLNHVGVEVKGYVSTCAKTGLTDGVKCSSCNEILIPQVEIPKLNHVGVEVKGYASTCTKTGLTDGVKCSGCEEILIPQVEIPKLNHVGVEVKGYVSTCAKTGLTDGAKCSGCEEILIPQVEIPKLNHVGVEVKGYVSTCTNTGLTDGAKCNTCNEILIPQVEIPKLNHVGVEVKGYVSTCTNTGLTDGVKCSSCNEILIPQVELPKNEHSYVEEVENTATCISSGLKIYTCSGCSDSYTSSYDLQEYSANEVYNLVNNSVGEITTYDKNGKALAIGTGFVYSSDGKIITNFHVIEDAYSAKIVLNGTSYNFVSVLGYNTTFDLAIIKINANNLTPINVCKKEHLVGSNVYAIGSSKGLEGTFSKGIITTAKRLVNGAVCVQHDAPISNGNSGGPLINGYGEVIGVNTWTVKDSQNVNLAVAITELDKLDLSKEYTLPEIYEKECDVVGRLSIYAKRYGTSNASLNTYELVLGETTSGVNTHTRLLVYNVESGIIEFMWRVNKTKLVWFNFTSLNDNYEWGYVDSQNQTFIGKFKPSSFNSSATLQYTETNVINQSVITTILQETVSMLDSLISNLDEDLSVLSITAKRLGFTNY